MNIIECLIVPPLRRKSVDAQGEQMGRVAESVIDGWKVGSPIDLRVHARRLLQTLAISLLFGDDRENGAHIAELTHRWIEQMWSPKTLCPLNVVGMPYHRMLKDGESLERRIVDWAHCKRGKLNGSDLFSIVVNNPDENGEPASDSKLVQHVPTLLVTPGVLR